MNCSGLIGSSLSCDDTRDIVINGIDWKTLRIYILTPAEGFANERRFILKQVLFYSVSML